MSDNKNLLQKKDSAEVALQKTTSLLSITNKILANRANRTLVVSDDAKKNEKVQYLLRVAAILHENTGPTLPLKNAYNLAEECLNELKGNISSGMFHDGPNPKENIMAYYSMCSMVNEMSAADDKMTVLKLSVMTRVLKDELGAFENMTSLEKGIWQFGEQVLAEMLELT